MLKRHASVGECAARPDVPPLRCEAVRWIQPSDLYVTIEDCSSPSAEPPVPATVHWRQRAAFTSRTRDRQSSYNPQLCCVRAHSKVVRRSLGDHSSTRARTRGVCSPAAPGRDTAISSEICGIILTTLPSRHPTRPAAAILGHECNICAALAIRRVCSAPRRRGSPSRTNTLRPGGARRDPRCESVGGARVPALSGTAAGAERAQIRPPRSPGSKRAVLTPLSGAFVDPTSSRSSLQKYLFTRSLPQVHCRLPTATPGQARPLRPAAERASRAAGRRSHPKRAAAVAEWAAEAAAAAEAEAEVVTICTRRGPQRQHHPWR